MADHIALHRLPVEQAFDVRHSDRLLTGVPLGAEPPFEQIRLAIVVQFVRWDRPRQVVRPEVPGRIRRPDVVLFVDPPPCAVARRPTVDENGRPGEHGRQIECRVRLPLGVRRPLQTVWTEPRLPAEQAVQKPSGGDPRGQCRQAKQICGDDGQECLLSSVCGSAGTCSRPAWAVCATGVWSAACRYGAAASTPTCRCPTECVSRRLLSLVFPAAERRFGRDRQFDARGLGERGRHGGDVGAAQCAAFPAARSMP